MSFDLLSKLTSAQKSAEVLGQSLEDDLVKRFLTSCTDIKLKEKILVTKNVDGKIRLADLKDRGKDYERHMAITGVSKPQSNSSKKVAYNPGSRTGSTASSTARGLCWICVSKDHFKRQYPKKCQHCQRTAIGTSTTIHYLKTKIRIQIQIILGRAHM